VRNRNIKIVLIAYLVIAVTSQIYAQGSSEFPLYKDSSIGIEQRVEDLLSRMTLKEKIDQMQHDYFGQRNVNGGSSSDIKSILVAGTHLPKTKNQLQKYAIEETRLGIPFLFGLDIIHGYRTIFPIPLAQSCSWNPSLIKDAAHIAAIEASSDGIRWTFAPMMDMTRDPRWGRVAETAGEDAYLTSALTSAMIEGFQGNDLSDPTSIAACAKHYVGYGAAEGGRDYNTTYIPERLLRNYYLLPFQKANEVGVQTYMSAFNDINGIPATGNEFTIRGILKNEWKFDGFVVSDYNSMMEMINHGYCKDASEVAQKSLRAGIDMEMGPSAYANNLEKLLSEDKIKQEWIDDAVRRILRVKFRLGLFENPFTDLTKDSPILNDEFKEVANELAAQSMVLLKNDKNILPLSKQINSVAVIGALADDGKNQMGMWALDGNGEDSETPLMALKEYLGSSKIKFAKGVENCRSTNRSGFSQAIEIAKNADVVLMFVGEDRNLTGESHSKAFLDLPGVQTELIYEIAKVNKNIILIMMAGRPLTFSDEAAKAKAILWAWHSGTMAGPATIDLLFGEKVPSGKLTISFPRTVGQIPIYYNRKNTGRPATIHKIGTEILEPEKFVSNYMDVDFSPQYSFGFGLSYNTYEYSNLKLSTHNITMNDTLKVSAVVKNNGKYSGDEIVQLYIQDIYGSTTRPVKELKGFKRVTLDPGEEKIVNFTLTSNDLAFYGEDMIFTAEPGDFNIWIGGSSESGLKDSFTLKQEQK